ILGAIFGWFIPTIAEWIVKIPFPYIPLEGLFVLVAGLKSGWFSVITALIGMIAGLIFVYFVLDRKSTRLNSSHVSISYAIFCLYGDRRDLLSFPTRRSSDLHSWSNIRLVYTYYC